MRSPTFGAAMLAAFLAMPSQVEAFWGKGHLLVSRRAQAILANEAEGSLNAALQELDQLTQSRPDIIQHEKDHPFTECATFADDIKETFGDFQTPWHFFDQPYLDEPDTTVDDFDFHPLSVNVVNALNDLVAFLKREPVPHGSTYLNQIAHFFPEEAEQRSFALRLIIHYVGDVHQPLHSVSEIDSRFPEGDEGGNLQVFPDTSGLEVTNLHSVWDSVIYQYTGYETMPFDETEWTWYSEEADKLHLRHPVDVEQLKPGQFSAWTFEGLDLAKSAVYAGFELGAEPSEEYKKQALPLLEERIMFGGARLAELIKDIYPEHTTSIPVTSDDTQATQFLQ